MALFGATLASPGAVLTMLRPVLRAFIGAGLANVGALLAERFRKLAPARHIGGGKTAYLRAVHI